MPASMPARKLSSAKFLSSSTLTVTRASDADEASDVLLDLRCELRVNKIQTKTSQKLFVLGCVNSDTLTNGGD